MKEFFQIVSCQPTRNIKMLAKRPGFLISVFGYVVGNSIVTFMTKLQIVTYRLFILFLSPEATKQFRKYYQRSQLQDKITT